MHDFKLFKVSELNIHPNTKASVDSGYQGLGKKHNKTEIPKKKTKKRPLTKEEKQRNRKISSERVKIENVFCELKRFKIISIKYRNRRKKFGLRINLIAGIYNMSRKGAKGL